MKKLLFVNACVNCETSRSLKLARRVIEAMQAEEPFEVTEVVLEEEKIEPLTSKTLNARQKLAEEGRLNDAAFAALVSSAMPTALLSLHRSGLRATPLRLRRTSRTLMWWASCIATASAALLAYATPTSWYT